MSGITIEIIEGPDAGKKVNVTEVLSIGRVDGNELVLGHPAVSRKHARIMRRGGGFFIEDLGSAHGTSVNDERIQSREIRPGDRIHIGPVRLKVVGGGEEDPCEPRTDVIHVRTSRPPSSGSIPLLLKSARGEPEAIAMKLEAIIQVGLSLQGERTIASLLKKICSTLLQTFDVDRSGIFLREKQTPEIVLSREGKEEISGLPFSSTLLAKAMDGGEALVTRDAGHDRRLQGASLTGGMIRSAMVAPLWGRERILGAVVVENHGETDVYHDEDLRLLMVMANLAGTALENAQLIDEVKKETEDRAALARFLSPAVAENIRMKGLTLELQSERREITVLFTDIRGFTTLSETLPPEELIKALNRSFADVIEIIFDEKGTIDKFTGDGVLALFGAPVSQPDHAARAISAARRIIEKTHGLKTSSGKEFLVGIGIATGEATVGPVGSSRRMEYTAIGDVVNVSARLVGVAGAGEILLTEETMTAAGAENISESLGGRKVKGKEKEVEIYRLKKSVQTGAGLDLINRGNTGTL